MIDELDLDYEDHDRDRFRHRRPTRRAQAARARKRRRGRSGLALILVVVLLGGIGAGVYVAFDKISAMFVAPDFEGAGAPGDCPPETKGDTTGPCVTIEIKPGEFIADIGNTLVRAGVVKSAKAFVKAAEDHPEATAIQPGFYRVKTRQSGNSAVLALLDKRNRIVNRFTVPEGMITLAIYQKLADQFGFDVATLKKLGNDPVGLGVPAWWFNRKDGKPAAKTVEGFLFPATYDFPPDVTPELALRTMVRQFLDVTAGMDFAARVQAERRISPYEALIAASIAQAEAVNDKDMGPVARALYNRVYAGKYGPCKCLQIDSAVNYWFRLQGKEPKDSNDLYRAELNDRRNPYNTHVVNGMPLGPISNPGEAALKGAMDPPPSDYVFFVTIDKQGTMGYARDGQLQTLIDKACRSGVLHGDLC